MFEKLNDKELDPVQILENDGDWSSGLFWAVVGFLNQTSRSKCVIKVSVLFMFCNVAYKVFDKMYK